MESNASPLPVTHVLDAYAAAGSGLWGKERLVESLMLAQRESGSIEPRLVVFAPCELADTMRSQDISVTVLGSEHRRVPTQAVAALRRALATASPTIVHTHGYKANLVGRLARVGNRAVRGLISTCHGWPDETRATKFYNMLDRQTVALSDVTTVPDEHMLALFPHRGRRAYVANGVPDRAPSTIEQRRDARAKFEFPPDVYVLGFLARTTKLKGLPEILEAARRSVGEPILWAIAGTGDLADSIAAANLPNVRYLGYVAESEAYLAAIDAFVQASYVEGLSLALLEAMRASLPVVATDVGSTALAVRDGVEGYLVAPGDVDALLASVRALARDAPSAARLGAAARERFVSAFRSDRQHRAFLEIYRSCDRSR